MSFRYSLKIMSDTWSLWIKLWFFWHFRIGQQQPSLKLYYTIAPEYSFSSCSWIIIYPSFGPKALLNVSYRLLSSNLAFASHSQRKHQYLLSKPQPAWYRSFFLRSTFVFSPRLASQDTLSFELFATQLFFSVFITLISLFLVDFRYVSSFSHLQLWFVLSDLLLLNLQRKPWLL